MATIKKAQLGSLIKKGVKKVTSEIIPVAEKNLTKMSPSYNKKGLNMSIERRVNPEAAKKKMTKVQRQSFEVDDSYRKNGGPIKKAQNGIAKYSDPKPLFEKLQKTKDSLYEAGKKLKVEKDLKNAGYLDQQRSLKAKFNEAAKNRNAKLSKHKNGGKMKKAQSGAAVKTPPVNPPAGATPGSGYKSFGKSGVSIKKCKHGCK